MSRAGMMKRGREGSIMMETVIAIPLYFILLGGIMWIGDLMIARTKLVIADRYAVWNYGCRYEPGGYSGGMIHSRFFDASEFKQVSGVTTEKTEYDWSQKASGEVRLQMRMPDWTRFMFNAGSVMYDTGVPEEQVQLRGRSLGGGHTVVMRTKREAQPDYIRNRYGIPESGAVARRYRDIYNEKWPWGSDSPGGGGSSGDGQEYHRYGQYKHWSE